MQAYLTGFIRMQDLAVLFFFKNEFYDFTNILQCLIERLPLRIAPFEQRAFDHIKPVLIFLYKQR